MSKILEYLSKLGNSFLKVGLPLIGVMVLCFFIPGAFSRCCSFKPVVIQDKDGNIDKARSDYYTTLKFYSQGGVKDAAQIGTVYEAVRQDDARRLKEQKLTSCKELYYPDGKINRTSVQYRDYLECISQ